MASLSRRTALTGALGATGGMLLGSGVAIVLLRAERDSGLTVLGSGRSLSALVNSERARIAILHGSDAADFGNALRRASIPLFPRTDIAIIPDPSGTETTFLRAALSQLGESLVVCSGDATPLLDAGISVDQSFVDPTRLSLPGEISLEVTSGTDAWSCQVSAADRTVRIQLGSSSSDIAVAGASESVQAWVQLDGKLPAPDVLTRSHPATVYIPAAAMSAATFRDTLQITAEWSPILRRVHAGEAERIAL
ncbi:MAG: hypothetical protein R2839_12885 [Thermomicrobiales bacterium]